MFHFQCIFVLKNIKNIKLKKQEKFSDNIKIIFSIFLKTIVRTVLKNIEKKIGSYFLFSFLFIYFLKFKLVSKLFYI